MRVLVVSPRIPFPPLDGAALRTFHLVRALTEHHDVTLVGLDYGDPVERPPFPIGVVAVPWEWPPAYRAMRGDDPERAARAFASLDADHAEPWFASCVASERFPAAVRRLARGEIDVAVFEESAMGRFAVELPDTCPAVLDLHNVHARMALREAGAEGRREAARTLRFERALAERCALLVTVSDVEAAAARELLGARAVTVVPNGVDTTAFVPGPQPDGPEVLFVGRMDYAPNVEAVREFVAESWPAVRDRVPDATFHVVGTDPVAEIRDLEIPGVVVHGRVRDVAAHHARAAVFVAPLRAGGGTRLKLLEAAACGKAIVTTSVGMEGLALRPGRDLVVADSPAELADATVALLRDADRRAGLGAAARRAARAYDWGAIGERFRDALEQVALQPVGGAA